jgi:hypothetical protein
MLIHFLLHAKGNEVHSGAISYLRYEMKCRTDLYRVPYERDEKKKRFLFTC